MIGITRGHGAHRAHHRIAMSCFARLCPPCGALLVAVAVLMLSSAAGAGCTCRCVDGEMQPLCSSAIDMPPMCPPAICPLTLPLLAPLDPPTIPPLGTSECRQAQVCNRSGNCRWQQVCR